MKRNLLFAILAPCILTVVLIIIIVIDSRNSKTPDPPANGTEVVGVVTPTEMPEPTITADPTTAPQATQAPSEVPTEVPTEAPTKAPTKAPAQVPSPTAIPTPTLSPVPTPVQEASGDITDAPQTPDGNGEPNDPTQGGTADPGNHDISSTYDALYTQQGDDYTLIVDGITGCYLFLDNNNRSLRQSEFKFAPEYREVGSFGFGPVFGYKNKVFFFMADNQLVASDGEKETVLYTDGGAYQQGFVGVNAFTQSENRIMLSMSRGTLVIADSRTLAVETYTQQYTPLFFALSDDALCFSLKNRIPAGRSFNHLYTASEGNVRQLGVIGNIGEYVLEGNTLIITNDEDSYQIEMSENRITASNALDKEYTLHLPVYVSSVIDRLPDIRYINYNQEAQPIQSIKMPASWGLQCYYAANSAIPYFYVLNDKEKSDQLPSESGRFTVVDTAFFPLVDSKYLDRSTMKEKLFEGQTSLGAGEIYLLEKVDPYYVLDGSIRSFAGEAAFEVIYAWIPIQGQTRAYQFYFYVPLGEAYQDYLTLMKYFIQAQ